MGVHIRLNHDGEGDRSSSIYSFVQKQTNKQKTNIISACNHCVEATHKHGPSFLGRGPGPGVFVSMGDASAKPVVQSSRLERGLEEKVRVGRSQGQETDTLYAALWNVDFIFQARERETHW